MIKDAVIDNFKCFKLLTLPDLGRITVIGGKNNVGKTALLEALFLFLDRLSPSMILRQYAWRGIEGVLSRFESMWSPIFENLDVSKKISISLEINGKREVTRYKYNPKFEIPSPSLLQNSDKPIEVRTDQEPLTSIALDIEYEDASGQQKTGHLFVDREGHIGLHGDLLRGRGEPAIFVPAKTHIGGKQLSDQFSTFAKRSRENEIVELLKLIEPRLTGLKVITEGPNSIVHGEIEGLPATLPLAYMGGGMANLLSMILAIGTVKGGTVFIDEIENGLHYSVMPKIWEAIAKAAKKYDCQIIATTHSYECLEAAHKGLIDVADEFRYIRLDRKDDKITAKTSNYEMLGTAISSNLEVR